jgi:hypothetical protein
MKLVNLFMLTAFFCALSLFSVGIVDALDEWVFVDIEPYSNTKLVDHEWWTLNAGDSTLSRLPIGEVDEFDGPDGKVEFQIIDGAIVVFGTNAAKWPKAVADIEVGGKTKFVYFFHATGWEQNGVPSYKFVMNYRDGKKEGGFSVR